MSPRTLTICEMVSMGLDSGSTSDKHSASNPTTISTLDIFRCSIPFVTALWIPVTCAAVNLNPTNSIASPSGCPRIGGAGDGAPDGTMNLMASGS